MKLEIQRNHLLSILQKVTGVIEKSNTIKVLENVLLQAEQNLLVCTGSDSNIQIVCQSQAEVENTGETTVLARKLHDICRFLPENSRIAIKHENNTLIVNSGRSRYSLKTLPAKDYPVLKNLDYRQEVMLNAATVKEAFEKTAFSMGLEDVRRFLNGLNLVFRGEHIEVFGTDGHRMARMLGILNKGSQDYLKIVIPRKAVSELLRVIDDEDEEIRVKVSKKNINFNFQNLDFTAKLMDEKFPDYSNIFPPRRDPMLNVNREEFRDALARASILSNEIDRGVLFKFEKDRIILKSNNSEREQAIEEIDVEYSGECFGAGYNSGYVLEALQKIDADRVNIDIDETKRSMLLTADKNEESKFLIMPMKI